MMLTQPELGKLIKVRNWARNQPDYQYGMKVSEFRRWMNKKLGTHVLGTAKVDAAAQIWLNAINCAVQHNPREK